MNEEKAGKASTARENEYNLLSKKNSGIVNVVLTFMLVISLIGGAAGFLIYPWSGEWGHLFGGIFGMSLFVLILIYNIFRVIKFRKRLKQKEIIVEEISKLQDEELRNRYKIRNITTALLVIFLVLSVIYIVPPIFAGLYTSIGAEERDMISAELAKRGKS